LVLCCATTSRNPNAFGSSAFVDKYGRDFSRPYLSQFQP
jgi:hypothetical protein